MNLSIWPKANPHPKGKEEKALVGFQTSAPNLPVPVSLPTGTDFPCVCTLLAPVL